MGFGVYDLLLGVKGILAGELGTVNAPGVKLLEALDLFLLGFLFIIFGIGFSYLFYPKPSKIMDSLEKITPDWLKVENFTELKLILWDTVLTTLVVLFVGNVIKARGDYDWELSIIPVSIVLISLSRFLIKRGIS